jgi:FMN-dependent NADH-azoreductase
VGYRHPNPRQAKIHRSYSVEEIARLFKAIDGQRPTVARGEAIRCFLTERRTRAKQPSGPGRIYCLPCRAPKVPALNMAECIKTGDTTGTLQGICPDCNRMIYRRVNPQKLDTVRGNLDITITQAGSRIKVSDDLVAELKAADHIVIGTPMFNFSIPAVLKAYIDQIVRVGVTVSPDNVGLLTGKKTTVILASGGDFSPGSPVEKYNQASGYLRQVLGWIGIRDVEIILANRARAGATGESAVEQFGIAVRSAAAIAPAVAA